MQSRTAALTALSAGAQQRGAAHSGAVQAQAWPARLPPSPEGRYRKNPVSATLSLLAAGARIAEPEACQQILRPLADSAVITKVAIAGYRSLRDVRIGLGPLNVVTGPNGSGKSSLYRALRLLADVAQGRIIQSLAGEGGLHSTFWAGPESFARSVKRGEHPVQGTVRKASLSLKLGFAGDDYGYAIDLGLPQPSSFGVRARPGDQGRGAMDRRDASGAATHSPCATGRACASAATPASGGRCSRSWRRSTA